MAAEGRGSSRTRSARAMQSKMVGRLVMLGIQEILRHHRPTRQAKHREEINSSHKLRDNHPSCLSTACIDRSSSRLSCHLYSLCFTLNSSYFPVRKELSTTPPPSPPLTLSPSSRPKLLFINSGQARPRVHCRTLFCSTAKSPNSHSQPPLLSSSKQLIELL